MKKVVIAFDNVTSPKGAIDFAVRMNEKSPILLTGAFLSQSVVSIAWANADAYPAGYLMPSTDLENDEHIEQNVDAFKRTCELNGIDYRIHKDFSDFSIPEIIKETRFADVLLVGSIAFYHHITQRVPSIYIKELLHNSECPVIVVPEQSEFPDNVILTYDGSDDSVYAIKQFAYLFDDLSNKRTTLVNINNKTTEDIPEKVNIEELAARHYSDLEIMQLTFDPAKYLSTWLINQPRAILVSGSFGRGDIARMFKHSFLSGVLKDQKVQIFIAHK